MAAKKRNRGPKSTQPDSSISPLASTSQGTEGSAAGDARDQSGGVSNDATRRRINKVLDKTVITIALRERIAADAKARQDDPSREAEPIPVIIDVNLNYADGPDAAREKIRGLISTVVGAAKGSPGDQGVQELKSELSEQYVFARLSTDAILKLADLDGKPSVIGRKKIIKRAIFHIWLDHALEGLIFESFRTVKSDAANLAFSARGNDIVWAVIDSGIDEGHPHFEMHENLDLPPGIEHRDFTATNKAAEQPLRDGYGHGTHVAGIIAGELTKEKLKRKIRVTTRYRDEHDQVQHDFKKLDKISGMAPECQLLSLRVMDDNGMGTESNLIAALEYIQRINNYGRPPLKIHGVNLSVGYNYDPEWFACGESPLCATVNRLVHSGVVVVAAAGNSGYGEIKPLQPTLVRAAALDMTINDPGNAELAITVGSTHRTMPHRYGVSYFSSKGPTGDGRPKPDLLAPGEKIISCRSSQMRRKADEPQSGARAELYREDSGTSMAAPHVSGVIAEFLSIRKEYIGQPEAVKKIFLDSATDLGRTREFQGRGLVDLMRAIQSV